MRLVNYQQFISESETKTSYSFDELPKESQKAAIEKNRDWGVESDDWYTPIIEGFEEDMEGYGIEDVKCSFTGFYSQGDGASFTGKISDNVKFIFDTLGMGNVPPLSFLDKLDQIKLASGIKEKMLKSLREDLYIWIERTDSRYSHENTVRVNLEHASDEDFDVKIGLEGKMNLNFAELLDKIEVRATEWVRGKSRELYRELWKYFEELQSDEYVADALRDNDYEFDINGNII
jgi:hypothetical protein